MSTSPSPKELGALQGGGNPVDRHQLLVGFLLFLLMAAFSFAQLVPVGVAPVGIFAMAVALVIGAFMPLAGMVSIALAIATLPLMRIGADLADIRADEIMMVAVVGGTFFRAVMRRDLPRSEVIMPVLVFVAVAGLSMAVRLMVTDYEIPFLSVAFPLAKHILRLLLLLTVAWLGSRLSGGLGTLRLALVVGAVAGALFGIAQSLIPGVEDFLVTFYSSIRGGEVRLFWGQRAFAAFDGNPNHLAASMLILASLALSTAEMARDRYRRSWWAAGVVMLFAIVASASRATGLVAVIMLLVKWLRGKRPLYRNALIAMLAYVMLVPNLLRTRVLQLIILNEGVISQESDILKKWIAWTTGFTRRETLKMTDNFYIDTVVNFWPVALVAFLWLMWVVYRRLRNEHRSGVHEPGVVGGAFLAFVAVAVLSMNGAFFSIPRVSEILWLVLGLAWAWFYLRDDVAQRERQESAS